MNANQSLTTETTANKKGLQNEQIKRNKDHSQRDRNFKRG